MFIVGAIVMFSDRKFEHHESTMHYLQLEPIRAIGTTNQVEDNSRLCDFL
jgi:hypothetical protein